jgi:flagellar protein FliS
MSTSASNLNAYTKVDVETASQGKLIVMLFNGAIKRTEEAKRQLEQGKMESVHNNLIRAQDILGELRGALNMKAGDISENLDRIYEYCQHLLVTANVKKDPTPLEECVEMMTSLRNTWKELFDGLAKDDTPKPAPKINQHGENVLNVQG